jgi:hypothetical protein
MKWFQITIAVIGVLLWVIPFSTELRRHSRTSIARKSDEPHGNSKTMMIEQYLLE